MAEVIDQVEKGADGPVTIKKGKVMATIAPVTDKNILASKIEELQELAGKTGMPKKKKAAGL